MIIITYRIIEIYSNQFVKLEDENAEILTMRFCDLEWFSKINTIINYDSLDGVKIISSSKFITLYHVSFDIENGAGYKLFTPCIPKSAPKYEGVDSNGNKIKRICFSDSVENCITAISDGVSQLNEKGQFLLYKVQIPLEDTNLVYYNDLYNYYNVIDANYTHEYWYTGKLFLKGLLCNAISYSCDDYYDSIFECDRERFYYELSCYGYDNSSIRSIDKYSNLFNFVNFDIYKKPMYEDLVFNHLSDILNHMNKGYFYYVTDLDYEIISDS